MGREPRTWEPEGLYHVVPKVNDGRMVFVDDFSATSEEEPGHRR
jgi:hypothetical protein